MTQAIVLFAHGARDTRWAEPFEAVAARVRAAAPGCPVVLAFLELMAPSLDEAVERLVAAGATRIDVVPLFLGTAATCARTCRRSSTRCAARIPAVAIRLHAAIGEHPEVVEAMARAAVAAAGFPE
jgi:sirohydrochlorin cobaltochelatase